MPRPTSSPDIRRALDRLRALSSNPPARAAFAASLLDTHRDLDLLLTALAALAAAPDADQLPALRALWAWAAEGGPKRDAGGFVRAAILRAMRDTAQDGDREIFDRATHTFEPSIQDRGGPVGVRAAGLICLFNVDQETAIYRAVELLADTARTSRGDGEPAVTAARILSAAEAFAPLLLCVLTGDAYQADVLAECLRGLAGAPAAAALAAASHFTQDSRETIHLGLCDLIISHPSAALVPTLRQLLDDAGDDIVRYLAVAVVASRRDDLLEPVLEAARAATSRIRVTAFSEALEHVHSPAGLATLALMKDRLAAFSRDRKPNLTAPDDDNGP